MTLFQCLDRNAFRRRHGRFRVMEFCRPAAEPSVMRKTGFAPRLGARRDQAGGQWPAMGHTRVRRRMKRSVDMMGKVG